VDAVPPPPTSLTGQFAPKGLGGRAGPGVSLRLTGQPLRLFAYPAETVSNRNFAQFDLAAWDRFFLPPPLAPLFDALPLETLETVEDDNRGAILPDPIGTLDGLPFYLSIKGVGSSVDPFSLRRLDSAYAAELTTDAEVRRRLTGSRGDQSGGVITGELWLRGSPYGGQGLPHATTALRVSEQADLTNLAGFRIAPVVKVALLPAELEERLRSIHWYRRYRGRLVQELRLVPSNVRIYFHAKSTVGNDPRFVFDMFGVDSPNTAHRFVRNLVRSAIPMLTLFARTLARDPRGERYSGLDFQDVWLDKDAVIAPDGTVFFVDLEGIDRVTVGREEVREKVEDQIYRSLYEFMFAYEQVDGERVRRFGEGGSRKRRFEAIVGEALSDDPYVRVLAGAHGLTLQVRNALEDESLWLEFPLVDA